MPDKHYPAHDNMTCEEVVGLRTWPEPQPWERKLQLRIFSIIGGLFIVVSLIFLFVPSPFCGGVLPGWLDSRLQKDALLAFVSTVGVSAIVIAWLIGVTEQTICGVRIGTLINWAYPGFFFYYFTVFLTTVLVGTYMGNLNSAGRFPMVMSAVGVTIGAIIIVRVCYVFIVPSPAREQIAYTYYDSLLEPSTGQGENFLRHCDRIIIMLAAATAQRESAGEDPYAAWLLRLWRKCLKGYRDIKQRLNSQEAAAQTACSELPPFDNSCCFLAEHFWDTLFQETRRPHHRLEFILYLNSVPKDECADHLISGLLLLLARESEGKGSDECKRWDRAYQFLSDMFQELQREGNTNSLTFLKLFWGTAWMMSVLCAYGGRVDFSLIKELGIRVHPDAENKGQPDKWDGKPSAEQAKEIETFLKQFKPIFLRGCGLEGELGYPDADYNNKINHYLTGSDVQPFDCLELARYSLGRK